MFTEVWYSPNNLELNTLKTVEMIVDFRRNTPALLPLPIMDSTVAAVESFSPAEVVFPSPAEAAHTVLLSCHGVGLCSSITAWFGSARESDLKRL